MPFAAQAALAIENAFAYRRIQELYEETLSLARARERILNHVSHELKTPIAIVSGSLRILGRKLEEDIQAQRAVERGARNIRRLVDIQRQMLDIYEAKSQGPRETELIEPVRLGPIVERALGEAREQGPDRDVEMVTKVEDGVAVEAPREPLRVTLDGLIRNAIENTPDESRVEIEARRDEEGLVLIIVRDFGVGITAESQKHLFEGFYHTQETDRYSSKRPYAFDAGGKGLDLLRTRTFAKRFGWDLELESERCRFIPTEADVCPGRISACARCEELKTCLGSGYTEFRLRLPEADSGA
jgi:signal transduction histidine kinase